MRTNEPDPHHAIWIIDFYDQSVMVAFDVEHDPVVRQERSTGIVPFNVVGPFPCCIFCFLVPGFELLLTVGMFFPKVLQCLFGYYSQIVFLAKVKKKFPKWEMPQRREF